MMKSAFMSQFSLADLPRLQLTFEQKIIIIRTPWLRKMASAMMDSEPEHFASSGPSEKIRAYFDSVT